MCLWKGMQENPAWAVGCSTLRTARAHPWQRPNLWGNHEDAKRGWGIVPVTPLGWVFFGIVELLRLEPWNHCGCNHGLIDHYWFLDCRVRPFPHQSQGHHWPQVSPGTTTTWLWNPSRHGDSTLDSPFHKGIPLWFPTTKKFWCDPKQKADGHLLKWRNEGVLVLNSSQDEEFHPRHSQQHLGPSQKVPGMQILEDGTSVGPFPPASAGPTLDLVKPQTPFLFAICAAEPGLSP